MFDSDLANLYAVQTKRLIQQVNRNSFRFPSDFMFQLTADEFEVLGSQIATSKQGGRRYAPYVFTEHGVLMLSSVLNSQQAIEVNPDHAHFYQSAGAIFGQYGDQTRN
jgi:hypothetical protein